jgi:hypothetical protein
MIVAPSNYTNSSSNFGWRSAKRQDVSTIFAWCASIIGDTIGKKRNKKTIDNAKRSSKREGIQQFNTKLAANYILPDAYKPTH